MKKAIALLAVLVMVASILTAGGSGESGSSSSGELSFGTGGDQGTYYGFGSVLAQRISSETDTKVTAVVSNGSQDNIEMMDMGYYQLGFVQSDVMSYAYDGTNLFEGNPIADFSTIGALYMEQVQIVTLNPNIKTVADLKGKTKNDHLDFPNASLHLLYAPYLYLNPLFHKRPQTGKLRILKEILSCS